MKHIVLITTSFPDLMPGSEAAGSFVADFAEVLSRYLRVSVIAPSQEEGLVRQGNLSLHRFAVPYLPLSLLSPLNLRHWPLIIGTLRAGNRAVRNLAGAEKLDHILALWALPSGFWARSIGKRHGIPYSVWALGSDIWSLAKIPLVKNVIRTVLRDCLVPFADGYLLQQDVEKIAGRPCEFLPSARILPISQKKKSAKGPPYRLAYLGRWHPNKGTDILCGTMEMFTDEDWKNIREIRIYGGGPLDDEVRASCAALRQAGRPVTVGGYLDKNQAAELLLWADYLLIPSRIESIPVVFSDAMQAGCPVITMPVGDMPRLLKTWRVGFSAKEICVGSFAEAMRVALNNPAVNFERDLQKAARAFDLTHAVQTFLEKTGMMDSASM